MKANYKEERIKFTVAIEKEVYRLIKLESDTSKKKKHPAKWYRDTVSNNLKLDESSNPSLRSYEELLRKYKKRIAEVDPLDIPWSIGSCLIYKEYFPPESIPILIECNQFLETSGLKESKNYISPLPLFISVRLAIWISRLEPTFKRYYPESKNLDHMDFLNRLIVTSFFYAETGEYHLANNKDFDSSLLDFALISGDLNNLQKAFYGDGMYFEPIRTEEKYNKFLETNMEKIKNRDKQISEFRDMFIGSKKLIKRTAK
jgi:hypothetical protein